MEKMSEITNATVASLNKAVDDKNPDDIQKASHPLLQRVLVINDDICFVRFRF